MASLWVPVDAEMKGDIWKKTSSQCDALGTQAYFQAPRELAERSGMPSLTDTLLTAVNVRYCAVEFFPRRRQAIVERNVH